MQWRRPPPDPTPHQGPGRDGGRGGGGVLAPPPAPIDDLLVAPHQVAADRRDAPYRLIFNRAGIGMARLSLSGSILEVNQRFADIVGRQPDQLTGLHADDIPHPQDVVPSRWAREGTTSCGWVMS